MNAEHAARQAVIRSIGARVGEKVGRWFTNSEMLQLAIASSLRSAKDLLCFMFSRHVAQIALSNANEIRLNEEEWKTLLGVESLHRACALTDIQNEESLQSATERLENALRCTVSEKAQGEAWKRPFTRASVFVAMHCEEHESLVAHSVGNIVKADCRRLEDLRVHLEDEEEDLVLISKIIASLSDAIMK